MEVFKIRLSELQMQGYCRQQEKRDLRTLHVFCIRAMKLEKFERSRSTVHVGAQDFVFKTTNIVARSELMAKKKMIKYRVCAIHILKKKKISSLLVQVFQECNSVHCEKLHSLYCLWVDLGWGGIRISLVHPALAQLPARWPGESAALLPGSTFSPCDGTRCGNSGSPSWSCEEAHTVAESNQIRRESRKTERWIFLPRNCEK